jgi:hypothetical protein
MSKDAAVGLFLLVFFGAIFVMVYVGHSDTERRFTDECKSVGGKAVWNGRHWECFRP